MPTDETPTPKLHDALVVPFYTKDQVEDHVSAILAITKLTEFANDLERQASAFEAIQLLWPTLGPQHQGAIRTRVCEALGMVPGRFDYLIELGQPPHGSATELRLGLRYRRLPFEREASERVYPTHTDGWLGRYLAYAEVGQAHVGWHFWAGITILSAACRRNFYLLDGDKLLCPNLYTLLEGPSGSGKNTAIERAQKLLIQMNHTLVHRATDSARIPTVTMLPAALTLRGLYQCLQGEQRLVGPLRPAQLPQDYESVACLVSPEAAFTIGKENHDVDKLIIALTNAYDGWLSDSTGMHGSIHLTNLSLTILLGSTMSWLRSNITEAVFQGGFMGARLYVIPKDRTRRRYSRSPVVDPVQRAALVDQLCWYATHPPTEMRFDPGAERLYDAWYSHQEFASEDDRINAYYARKDIFIQKLAMNIAISRGHIPVITTQDMSDTLELVRYEEPGMLSCFRQIIEPEQTGDAEWVSGMVRRAGGQMLKSTLTRAAASKLRGVELKMVLDQLEDWGRLKRRVGKPGRGPNAVIYYDPGMVDENGLRREAAPMEVRHPDEDW